MPGGLGKLLKVIEVYIRPAAENCEYMESSFHESGLLGVPEII